MLLTCDVNIEVADILERASIEELLEELRSRDEHASLDYDRVYQMLALKDTEALVREITEIVQKNTGRIVP